ncbi:MAG: 16S rRNA (guanine(527)-N(7))-methyltransferase RsmG [Solobacterium sp.]|nr:16S rRNA (guanine(527)-N(7))-methyltransferase RsmG [Solobacterium sp.]
MEVFEFIELLKQQSVSLPENAEEKFTTYTDLLIEWNAKMNLTSITNPSDINEKHYYDCLLPMTFCPYEGSLLDVGSGAGFPGIVLAIARPDLQVTLLEPIQKRCRFLQEIIEKLTLKNVEIIHDRAEKDVEIHREIFDIVTARAVANLQELSELCIPFVKIGGKFLAMKGTNGQEEAEKAQYAIQELGGKLEEIKEYRLPTAGNRTLIVINKVKETPKQYPRDYSQIKKKPLSS